MLYEGARHREIFLDGRPLPKDPEPSWYGYSIGRWEGDTFVVETAGFKEGSWLDNNGHPHSDALRTTERFRRVNFGHLEVEVAGRAPPAREAAQHDRRLSRQSQIRRRGNEASQLVSA